MKPVTAVFCNPGCFWKQLCEGSPDVNLGSGSWPSLSILNFRRFYDMKGGYDMILAEEAIHSKAEDHFHLESIHDQIVHPLSLF